MIGAPLSLTIGSSSVSLAKTEPRRVCRRRVGRCRCAVMGDFPGRRRRRPRPVGCCRWARADGGALSDWPGPRPSSWLGAAASRAPTRALSWPRGQPRRGRHNRSMSSSSCARSEMAPKHGPPCAHPSQTHRSRPSDRDAAAKIARCEKSGLASVAWLCDQRHGRATGVGAARDARPQTLRGVNAKVTAGDWKARDQPVEVGEVDARVAVQVA